jgi:hypothetical protein
LSFPQNGTERQADRTARRACWCVLIALFLLLLATVSATAETLKGTVTNGTTGKPAAGDDVVLINLGQGMDEAGRTKTDAQGKFSFNVPDAGAPHLIRVIHQGATYHTMAPPGTTAVSPEVYDVAKKVDGVSVVADLMYLQAGQGQLGVNRLFAVDNNSKPPRTQLSDRDFQFYLPVDAEIDQAQAQTAGGQWVNATPVPQTEKGRYAFIFPLRPGTTQFQISYHLPYNGSAKVDPKPLYPMEHLVVILPQSIQFSAAQPQFYQDKQPPDQPKAIAKVAANIQPGQALSFSISGTGMLQDQNAGAESGGGGVSSGTEAADSRPGGGLGPPIDAPDPLEKYRWYILGGFAAILAAGAFYIAKRPQTAAVPDIVSADVDLPKASRAPEVAVPKRSGLLLEALKEELFELEVEHKQGRISQQEYAKAKAALDQTLDRALKRKSHT